MKKKNTKSGRATRTAGSLERVVRTGIPAMIHNPMKIPTTVLINNHPICKIKPGEDYFVKIDPTATVKVTRGHVDVHWRVWS